MINKHDKLDLKKQTDNIPTYNNNNTDEEYDEIDKTEKIIPILDNRLRKRKIYILY